MPLPLPGGGPCGLAGSTGWTVVDGIGCGATLDDGCGGGGVVDVLVVAGAFCDVGCSATATTVTTSATSTPIVVRMVRRGVHERAGRAGYPLDTTGANGAVNTRVLGRGPVRAARI